jgi:hypothetical protein
MAISELTATRPKTLSRVCALITLKLNQPTVSIQAPSAQQNNRGQGNPTAQDMHPHATGKIMDVFTRQAFDSGLHTQVLVPHDAFKDEINQTHNDGNGNGNQLWPELGMLGNAAQNNGCNGGRKSQ